MMPRLRAWREPGCDSARTIPTSHVQPNITATYALLPSALTACCCLTQSKRPSSAASRGGRGRALERLAYRLLQVFRASPWMSDAGLHVSGDNVSSGLASRVPTDMSFRALRENRPSAPCPSFYFLAREMTAPNWSRRRLAKEKQSPYPRPVTNLHVQQTAFSPWPPGVIVPLTTRHCLRACTSTACPSLGENLTPIARPPAPSLPSPSSLPPSRDDAELTALCPCLPPPPNECPAL